MTETVSTSPDFLWLFLQMVMGLVVVLGLALLLIRYLLPRGRWGRGKKAKWATVVGRILLEPRKGVYLLKVAGRYLVVGSTEQSMALLAELSKTEGEEIEGS